MNFDPISYLMHREQIRDQRDRAVDQTLTQIQIKHGEYEKRIDSLESWRISTLKTMRKWPYVAIPAALIVANLEPKETVAIVKKILTLLL